MLFAFRRHLLAGLAAQVLLVGCTASAHAARPPISPDLTTNIVALLLLLARLGDIGSTYLATPKLLLEMNPVVRRLKWPSASASLLLAFVPYFSLSAGIFLLVGSLLVCSSNFSGLWMARTVGEEKYLEFITLHARRTEPISALLPTLIAGACLASVGLLLLYLPDATSDVALGIIGFAFAMTYFRWVAFIRLHKRNG